MQRNLRLHVRFEDASRTACTISIEEDGNAITRELHRTDIQEVKNFFERRRDLLVGSADPYVRWLGLQLNLADRDDLHVPIADRAGAYKELGFDL